MVKDKIINQFLLVTFAVGVALQALYFNDENTNWLLLSMWAPTIGVIALWKNSIPVFSELKKINFSWIVIGILLAFVPFVLSQFIIWAFDLGVWNQSVVLSPDKLSIIEITKANLVLGNQPQNIFYFAFNVFVSLLLGGLITTFIGALGEEIGWRGFLQSKLSIKYGPTLGTFLVGVIWAYWHIPANLGGINGKENILLTTFITFPLSVVFMSFALGWLRLRSQAIWPCAFFHGVNNAVSGFYLIKPNSEINQQIVDLVCSISVGTAFFTCSHESTVKTDLMGSFQTTFQIIKTCS